MLQADGAAHRSFLSDYYSGAFPGSHARGLVFQYIAVPSLMEAATALPMPVARAPMGMLRKSAAVVPLLVTSRVSEPNWAEAGASEPSARERADKLSLFATYFGDPSLVNDQVDRYRAVTAEQVSGERLKNDRRAALLNSDQAFDPDIQKVVVVSSGAAPAAVVAGLGSDSTASSPAPADGTEEP